MYFAEIHSNETLLQTPNCKHTAMAFGINKFVFKKGVTSDHIEFVQILNNCESRQILGTLL